MQFFNHIDVILIYKYNDSIVYNFLFSAFILPDFRQHYMHHVS